jgi:ABC-type glycerol-3-phosphate transport system substrate-binding protein
LRLAGLLLAVGLFAAACGGGDDAGSRPDGVTTRHDDGCVYEGPTEFAVNSDVTFTFINESEVLDAGFAVHKVDEGTTVEEILDLGVWAVSNEEADV